MIWFVSLLCACKCLALSSYASAMVSCRQEHAYLIAFIRECRMRAARCSLSDSV
uniref:Secreted protein n=1 Tax=Arundo donax TaxID=35708 RepID=A0A0A9B619_ARUDO